MHYLPTALVTAPQDLEVEVLYGEDRFGTRVNFGPCVGGRTAWVIR